MDTIVVGFSRPSSWVAPFSWLIRLAYWSAFSHVYVKINMKGLERTIVFQASGLVVNLESETEFDNKEIIYKEFVLNIKDDKKELLQFAIDQLGKPYNVKGILGMALVRIGQIIGLKISNPFSYDGSSDFCSELIGYVLKTYTTIVITKPIANLAPKDVYKIMVKATSQPSLR